MKRITATLLVFVAFSNIFAQSECFEIILPSGNYFANSQSSGEFFRNMQDCEERKNSIGLFWKSGDEFTAACDRSGLSRQPSLKDALKWVLQNCPEANVIQLDDGKKQQFLSQLDKKIVSLYSELDVASTPYDKGNILKQIAELTFEKSLVDSQYLMKALQIMKDALLMADRSGDATLRSEILTALGNLSHRLNRDIEAYDYYKSAAETARGIDIYAYFEAELNRCVICCQKLIDEDIEFRMKAYMSAFSARQSGDTLNSGEIDGNSCCKDIPLKLVNDAEKVGKIDLAFLAYRQYYSVAQYAASVKNFQLKNEIEEKVVELALRLMTESEKSRYDKLALETILPITQRMIETLSRSQVHLAIEWLKKCKAKFELLNDPHLSYEAYRQLGLARKNLFYEPEEAVKNLKLALLLGIRLGTNREELHEIRSALILTYVGLGQFDQAEEVATNAIEIAKREHDQTYEWYMLMGNIADTRGDYTKAINEYQKAIEISESISNYDNAVIRYNMSFVYQNIGEYEAARQKLQESLDLFGQALKQYLGFDEKHPIPEVESNHEYYIKKTLEFINFLATKGITEVPKDGALSRLLIDIQNCYEELAKISRRTGRLKEAKENYLRAAKYFERATHYY